MGPDTCLPDGTELTSTSTPDTHASGHVCPAARTVYLSLLSPARRRVRLPGGSRSQVGRNNRASPRRPGRFARRGCWSGACDGKSDCQYDRQVSDQSGGRSRGIRSARRTWTALREQRPASSRAPLLQRRTHMLRMATCATSGQGRRRSESVPRGRDRPSILRQVEGTEQPVAHRIHRQ
jgi:hypothetical protein